jgi:hypothetical protein
MPTVNSKSGKSTVAHVKESGSDIDVLTKFRRQHCRTPKLGARGFFEFRRSKERAHRNAPLLLTRRHGRV